MFDSKRARWSQLLVFTLAVSTGATTLYGQCPPAYVFLGESAGDRMGAAVAAAGDIDQDGFGDVIVGAFGAAATALTQGRVYVFSGQTGSTIHTFVADSTVSRLGFSVAGIGDIDNDSVPDLLVGAPIGGTTGAGAVIVYSGATGDVVHKLAGELSGDSYGWSVAGLGDINADGVPDFAVSANNNDAGTFESGRVYVYSGLTGDELLRFSGAAALNAFGYAVAGAGDVDGDSVGDIIIGAPNFRVDGLDVGRVYVFSGATGDTIHLFTGAVGQDGLGRAVAGAGDVNGDGLADILISAPRSFTDQLRGRAFIYSGLDGSLLHTFIGEDDNDEFGHAVASIGDFDGDSVPDLVCGSRYGGSAEAGRSYLFSGATGAPRQVYSGSLSSDFFGLLVAGAGDINNDGIPDLIVGSPGADGTGISAGAAFVFALSADADGDGYGARCDCDDNDSLLFPGTIWYEDLDGDGFGDPLSTQVQCEELPGFVLDSTDCNDSDSTLSPGTNWFGDFDGDGFGDSLDVIAQCTQPTGYILNNSDNCPVDFNPDQADANGNGIGDLCDCACDCHVDPQCDGLANVLDLVATVNVAFRGEAPILDPDTACPVETTDADCSGATDVLDVVRIVNVAFRGADPAAEFCVPCP